MLERPEQGLVRTADGKNRFDGETVRRILGRAAAEQHRLDHELADAYSLEELEEMAAEAGISRQALRVAIESPPESPATSQRWMPRSWSPAVKGIVLASVAGIALFSVLAFPAVAQVLLWVTILSLLLLSVLIALGASPF